jgi:ribosomal protein S18 acetylase RimI-like enzyme
MIVTSRPYQGEHDLAALKAFLAQAGSAAAQAHYLHSGDMIWQLFHMLSTFDPAQIVRLWEDEQSRLIGFVLLYPRHGGFEIQIGPRWRDQATAKAMLDWAEAQLLQWPREHSGFSTIVNQHDAILSTLLERSSYARGGEWLYMQRSLEAPIAPIPPPLGFTVRGLRGLAEAEARAAVLGQAFEAPPFVEWYRKLMQAPGYEPELDLVAVAADGQFGAFALCWVDQAAKVGQFEPVGTAPAFRRQGLARAVLNEGLRRMRARGMETAIVVVEAAEPAACRLYESVGFETMWRLCSYEKGY